MLTVRLQVWFETGQMKNYDQVWWRGTLVEATEEAGKTIWYANDLDFDKKKYCCRRGLQHTVSPLLHPVRLINLAVCAGT